jgi:hypothetical protein
MARSISGTRKGRGRPSTGATSIHLRILPDELEALDEWCWKQPDVPSRPEAIRRLLEYALRVPAARQLPPHLPPRTEEPASPERERVIAAVERAEARSRQKALGDQAKKRK